jgi:hypothetical protein
VPRGGGRRDATVIVMSSPLRAPVLPDSIPARDELSSSAAMVAGDFAATDARLGRAGSLRPDQGR